MVGILLSAPIGAGTVQAPAPDFTLPARAGGEL
jgi:hypothetical protein